MATLWESLATRDTRLLRTSLTRRFRLPPQTSWVNYVRSHDDIGWTFSDEDAWELGINPEGHRDFLNQFFCNLFDGSFARGLSFQYNPENGDRRICGTTASLCGIEEGLNRKDNAYTMDGIRRLLLLYGVVCSVGGIPLLYLGDEWAALNDLSFQEEEAKVSDQRWVHRPRTDWKEIETRMSAFRNREEIRNGAMDPVKEVANHDQAASYVFRTLKRMFSIRENYAVLSENSVQVMDAADPALLIFQKGEGDTAFLVAGNFSEQKRGLNGQILGRVFGEQPCIDLLSGESVSEGQPLKLQEYQLRWITVSPSENLSL